MYAPPAMRGGLLYRGVVATDDPAALLPEMNRDNWVVMHWQHNAACPPYHPAVDLYQLDAACVKQAPGPHVVLTARELTSPDIFRPLPHIAKQYDIIFNATWLKVKRPELMLKTLDCARKQGRPVTCLWFGYHWRTDSLKIEEQVKEKVKKMGLPVTFMETNMDREVVNERYNACRAAVLCSLREGAPRVMAEALLANIPYVTTQDTEGSSPSLINPLNGRLAAPTPKSLAQAIWHVLDHADSYQPRHWALKHMCLPVGLQNLKAALEKLAAEKSWRVNTEEINYTGIDWRGHKQAVQQAESHIGHSSAALRN